MSTHITNEIINKINEFQIKNEDFAALKNDLYSNTDGENYQDLLDYDLMLSNISIGSHTNTVIELAGIEWRLRLLESEEFIEARVEVNKMAKEKELFDDWYVTYLLMIKILSLALSFSPFKTKDKNVWTEQKLRKVNYDVLEMLYEKYLAFVQVATRRVDSMTEQELQDLIEIVKKNSGVLMALDRRQLLIMSRYLLNGYQNLEKIIKSE